MYEHRIKGLNCIHKLCNYLDDILSIPNMNMFSISKKEPLNKEILDKFLEVLRGVDPNLSEDDKFYNAMEPNVHSLITKKVLEFESKVMSLYNLDAGLFAIFYHYLLKELHRNEEYHFIIGETLGLPSIRNKIHELYVLELKNKNEAYKLYTKDDVYKLLITPVVTDELNKEIKEQIDGFIHSILMNDMYDSIHEYPGYVCLADTLDDTDMRFLNTKMVFITDLLFHDPYTLRLSEKYVNINNDLDVLRDSIRIEMICESGFNELMDSMNDIVDEAEDTNVFKMIITEFLSENKELLHRINNNETMVSELESSPKSYMTEFVFGFYDKLVKRLHSEGHTSISNIDDVFRMVLTSLRFNPVISYGLHKHKPRAVLNTMIAMLLDNKNSKIIPTQDSHSMWENEIDKLRNDVTTVSIAESIIVAVYAISIDYLMEYIDLFVDIFDCKPSLLFSTCLKYEQTLER